MYDIKMITDIFLRMLFLCPMTVGNDTVYAWHACSGIPTLNKCPYSSLCPKCMTLFISKPSYYYTLLSVFGYFIRIISLLSYYYTLLSQLSHLQFLDYYTLLYALNHLYYYTHYLIPIIPIILFRDYYFNYRYYSTIIPIILNTIIPIIFL